MELVQDEVVIEEPAPIDFNWCEEISNCGDLISEKDIPATIEEEVVAASVYDDTDESFDNQSSSQEIKSNDESHSAVNRKRNKQQTGAARRSIIIGSANPRSLLKTNFLGEKSQMATELKFTKTLVINRSLLKNATIPDQDFPIKLPLPKQKKKSDVSVATTDTTITKFKHSIKMKKNSSSNGTGGSGRVPFQSKNLRKLSKQLQQRTDAIARSGNTEKTSFGLKSVQPNNRGASGKGGKIHTTTTTTSVGKGNKRFVDLHGENITINHDVEGVGDDLNEDVKYAPITCSNTVKIDKNCDTDSDLEIEVDIETDNTAAATTTTMLMTKNDESTTKLLPSESKDTSSPAKSVEKITSSHHLQSINQHKDYPDNLASIMESNDKPIVEHCLDSHTITDLEKYFHSEFFEGRPTKTPERYVKIRTYILDTWSNIKPAYVSKTAIRNGLKNCGDVNCIGRIHSLFEQIGAINFGYDGIQFTYIRPLTELQKWFTQSQIKGGGGHSTVSGNNNTAAGLGKDFDFQKFDRRQRTKTLSESNSSSECVVDVNYTLRHDDSGPTQLIVAPSINANETAVKFPRHGKRSQIPIELELIECHRFGIENLAPFKVSITLSTLLCIQLHSLSAKHEVMGFLGGYRSKTVGRNKLSLTRYKPCKTSEQNGTMCEMCPISQVEQSSSLIAEGNELLGWFHSHPKFPPNPSRTDVRTQAEMQHQFVDKPFIGFILGCIDMKYKYVEMIVLSI